ncbi:MAG: hypothetical protein ABEI80_01665 [Haloplanus sp.]
MPASATEELAASLHRGILGALLAIVGLGGLGLARRLLVGEYLTGAVGAAVALGAGYWILSLFRDGLRER